MEFTKKEDLEKLSGELLVREADLIIKFINRGRKELEVIKEILDKREEETGKRFYEGDLLMPADRELLKDAIGLLVALDKVAENELPEWYSSAQLIAEVDDFYKKAENDDELGKVIAGEI